MTNPRLLVFTNPSEGQDSDYNEWYTNTHLPEVLKVPGIIAAQRWRVGEQPGAAPVHRYLAIYELDERPPADAIAALVEAAPTMIMSPALGDAQMILYQPISDRVLAGDDAAV